MARVFKPPSPHPPFGKTPLTHGSKVQIVSLCSGKVVKMDPNGALRANFTTNDLSGSSFIVSQLGAAVMLQCPATHHIIGANAGYLYGFPANQQQAALRVYYHEDSGAIEFESCADPGKFLAFDKSGNVIPLNGTNTPIQRQFAVRCIRKDAASEAPKGALDSLFSMGKKAVNQVVGEGKTQYNFEKNKLRNIMGINARVRLRRRDNGRYLAIMNNGIVHGNGDQTDILIVHHCFGVLRYAFQSAKFPQLWLSVTLDHITWAMVNNRANMSDTENPLMVWEVDRCKSDGTVLLRRHTQVSTGNIHQYLGFGPNGKPTPTLIFPEEMGDLIIESAQGPLHAAQHGAIPIPVPPQYNTPPPPTSAPPPPTGASAPPTGASAPPYSPPSAPGVDGSGAATSYIPPGALLYDGSNVVMKNKQGYLCVNNGLLTTTAAVNKDCDFKLSSAGSMSFTFENVKNGVFLTVNGNDVAVGAGDPGVFQVSFNPNGSVTFEAQNSAVLLGMGDPEIFLEIA